MKNDAHLKPISKTIINPQIPIYNKTKSKFKKDPVKNYQNDNDDSQSQSQNISKLNTIQKRFNSQQSNTNCSNTNNKATNHSIKNEKLKELNMNTNNKQIENNNK